MIVRRAGASDDDNFTEVASSEWDLATSLTGRRQVLAGIMGVGATEVAAPLQPMMDEGMHHANYHYGHAHLLARYCTMPEPTHPPRLQGYLQHGWNMGDGLAPGTPYVEGSRIFVWSEETRRRSWSQGRREVIVVGAPFAYLMEMQPEPIDAPEPQGTIFYPFHGWEGQQISGDHQRLIDEVKATEPGPVTACIYWN